MLCYPGADISVISVSTYQALPQPPKLKTSNAVLSSPGTTLKVTVNKTGYLPQNLS